MAYPYAYMNDEGTEILVDMQENISTASTISFIVEKPDHTVVEWDGVTIDGTDYFRYLIQSGDLDIPGKYYIYPHFTYGAWTGSCNPAILEVLYAPELEEPVP